MGNLDTFRNRRQPLYCMYMEPTACTNVRHDAANCVVAGIPAEDYCPACAAFVAQPVQQQECNPETTEGGW